jgi:hypothetical protein
VSWSYTPRLHARHLLGTNSWFLDTLAHPNAKLCQVMSDLVRFMQWWMSGLSFLLFSCLSQSPCTVLSSIMVSIIGNYLAILPYVVFFFTFNHTFGTQTYP